MYDSSFRYKEGKTCFPKKEFNRDISRECESGIHFYLDKKEAENY